jgi:hypothetical protein
MDSGFFVEDDLETCYSYNGVYYPVVSDDVFGSNTNYVFNSLGELVPVTNGA